MLGDEIAICHLCHFLGNLLLNKQVEAADFILIRLPAVLKAMSSFYGLQPALVRCALYLQCLDLTELHQWANGLLQPPSVQMKKGVAT